MAFEWHLSLQAINYFHVWDEYSTTSTIAVIMRSRLTRNSFFCMSESNYTKIFLLGFRYRKVKYIQSEVSITLYVQDPCMESPAWWEHSLSYNGNYAQTHTFCLTLSFLSVSIMQMPMKSKGKYFDWGNCFVHGLVLSRYSAST